ncbi:sigma-70 family RNA polymerase sigma factor [Eubacteriales bacterium OttesenSCG-928-K08]|nr:sigma-70 family RNA polymerase sigma factor [Eubacteriales bacterium OttesenSCG-928-K08]
MDNPFVTIEYKTAEGKRICLEVSIEVKELLEQSDRQIRSQRRQDRRYLTDEEYIDGLTDTTTVYPQEDFADLLYRMCNYQRLYATISKLPDTQKRRLTLYYFGGLTYRQIAKIEGVGFRTVARSVERAVNTLRKVSFG